VPISIQREEPRWQIRLEGQVTVASATELKAFLMEWLVSEKDLDLDLAAAEEIDITTMQLLWAAARDAERKSAGVSCHWSAAAVAAIRAAGFDGMPGLTGSQGLTRS
jgi:two-component system chemotaxis sensor kinase CheA